MDEWDFVLSKEELDDLFDLLDGKYSKQAIVSVHAALLLTPRLVGLGVIPIDGPVNLMDPSFKMEIFHICAALRLISMSKYGLMHNEVNTLQGLKGWIDIRMIVRAMQLAYEKNEILDKTSASLWLANFVDLKFYRGRCVWLDKEEMFSTDTWTEVEFSDMVMDFAFENLDLEEVSIEAIDFFAKFTGELYREWKRKGGIQEDPSL
jgi:hypothetical protein